LVHAVAAASAFLLFAASRLAASPPPDLLAAAEAVRQIPGTSGTASESVRLRRFFDLHWAIRMRQNPSLATYIGYPGLNDRWPDASPASLELYRSIGRDEIRALDSIDRAKLTPAEQTHYDLLRRRLTAQPEGERFEDFADALAIDPMGGVDLELLYLLGAAPVRTTADFEAIIARLRGFPEAVEQTLDSLRKGLAKGITPPKVTLREVPARVASLLADDPWKSAVLDPFRTLPVTIPAAEQERLRAQAVDAYTRSVAPAVRKLHDYLARVYVPGARESTAMSALPGGREYYAYQLRSNTTTSLTPEEVHQLGLAEVARIRREMEAAIAATGFHGSLAELTQFLRTDPRFFYDRPEDLVAGFREITKRIDPGLIKLFGRLPRLPYGVKAMEGAGAKSAPAAYYNNGSLAGGNPGWFLINTYDLKSRPKWAMEALALHETVPGHHLQYSLAEEIEDIPDWRKWDVYGVFGEGWGLYAESLGSELGLYRDPYSRIGQLTNEIWRALRLVVDPGLHVKGWSRQEAIDYYKANCAKSEHEIEAEVDRIIVHPGTVPVYKIGELKIRELRTYAEKELGPDFDVRAFHDRLLGRGQLPLDLLEASMKGWVAEVKAGLGRKGTP
jgi:uncharacterized protein (DUF885 family)